MGASAARGARSSSPSSGGGGGGRRGRVREAPADTDREPGPDADPESVARRIVLTQLTTRARTRAELAATLTKRDVPADVAVRVLDRMTEVGLIDDAAFADEWVRQRQETRGLSRRALADELRRKGIADEVAAAVLGEVSDEAERGRAFELARRKARASRGLAHEVRVRRLAGMLARKGYSPAIAYAAVRDALAAEGLEFDD